MSKTIFFGDIVRDDANAPRDNFGAPLPFAGSTKEILEVDRSLFGHMHIRGMTGSGKTSLALIPLLEQFIKPYHENGKTALDPVFVIDLGGDPNLFFATANFAKQSGRRFRYLALDSDVETYCFPPFQAMPPGANEAIRISQLLIRAFSMDYGLVYGGSYYSQQNLSALVRVARRLSTMKQTATIRDIANFLEDPEQRRILKDADQVRMTFDFLLEYPQLSESKDPADNILLERAIEDGEVIYFFTPTLSEPTTARLVAGLGLYSIIAAAIERTRKGKELRSIRVFIDEFQEIVGSSLAALLAQSRKFGISLFLANQSTSQLRTRDLELDEIVFEGTQVKQYFTCVGEIDTKTLQTLSLDESKMRKSSSQGGQFQSTEGQREEIAPILERNDILDTTFTFGDSFVVIMDGQGHSEPYRIRQRHAFDFRGRAMPARKRVFAESSATPNANAPRVERWRETRAASITAEQKAFRRKLVNIMKAKLKEETLA